MRYRSSRIAQLLHIFLSPYYTEGRSLFIREV